MLQMKCSELIDHGVDVGDIFHGLLEVAGLIRSHLVVLCKVRSFLFQLLELFSCKETLMGGFLLNRAVLIAEIFDPFVLSFLHNFKKQKAISLIHSFFLTDLGLTIVRRRSSPVFLGTACVLNN